MTRRGSNRRTGPSCGGWWAIAGWRHSPPPRPLAALRRLPALREFLPTVIQVGVQDASWRQGSQDLLRTGDALCEAARLRGHHRRNEGPIESGGRATRPLAALGGDPI